MLTHETLHSRLHIEATLHAKTALRIGSGRDIEPHTPDLPILRDGADRPYIPGSSLKGVLRSGVEQLARGLAAPHEGRMRRAACIVSSEGEWCVKAERRDSLRQAHTSRGRVDEGAYTKALWDETCRVCRVFGSPWFAGKLSICDLPLTDDPYDRETTETRNGVAIDRDSGTAADKNLYKYEVARPGLAFGLRATLENGNRAEQGMVLMAFRLLERGDLRIGGATSRGLGAVEVLEASYRLFAPGDADSLVAYLMGDPAAAQPLRDVDALIGDCVADLRTGGA